MASLIAPTVPPANVGAWPTAVNGASRRATRSAAGRPGLEPALQRELSVLVDWQLWYWGQDIHAPQQNALLAYGFSRTRGPSDGTQRSSAYCLEGVPVTGCTLHGLSRLLVWGFAITAVPATLARASALDVYQTPTSGSPTEHPQVAAGSLVLVRHDRAARWCSQPISIEAGTRDLLPTGTLPQSEPEAQRCLSTLASVARCCADYEQWVHAELGEAHRREAFIRRPRATRRRDGMPSFLHGPWLELAERVAMMDGVGTVPPATSESQQTVSLQTARSR